MRVLPLTFMVGLLAGCAASAPAPVPHVVVFFPEWSAAIDAAAGRAIDGAARAAHAAPAQSVVVTGFADPAGSRKANLDLSRLRAQVVIDRLEADGVAAARIRRAAAGPTSFALSAQESRRVEISVGTP
ncbi:MAG TPA: OmpA family protein [Acetobacteraceae bacterium]|nr:OmpA family protein [Acetobacteraceae bacterium]